MNEPTRETATSTAPLSFATAPRGRRVHFSQVTASKSKQRIILGRVFILKPRNCFSQIFPHRTATLARGVCGPPPPHASAATPPLEEGDDDPSWLAGGRTHPGRRMSEVAVVNVGELKTACRQVLQQEDAL